MSIPNFLEGTYVQDADTAGTTLDYTTYPTSLRPNTTTKLFNQLILSLQQQQNGSGDFMMKTVDGDLINDGLFLKMDKASYNNIDNTSDANKPVSTATQTALDLKANLANPTFTGIVNGITKAMVGLTNAQNTTDANKPVSTATQTALDLKAPLLNPAFTGTVTGITKEMVGLSNVNDTTDVNKPVSTATQTALDAKANLSGATFTGGVFFTSNAPACSIQPTINSHLANKRYIDENCLLLNGNQVMTGTKTFNNIVITGTQTETGNMIIGDATTDTLTINSTTVVNGVSLNPTQLSNIKWLNNVASNIQPQIDAKTTISAVQSNNNTFSGSNSFNTSLPTSTLTPLTDTQLITKLYCDNQISNLVNSSPENLNSLNELSNAIGADANFSTTMTNLIGTKVGLTSNNSITGINTYSQLPLTAIDLTPTNNKELTPKKWCDDTFVKLGSNNTLTGVQNFNNNVVIGDGVGSDVMTINCNILTNTHIVPPSTLARVRFLSNITSDVHTNVNSKASLTLSNTFTNTNTFNNLPLISSDLTPNDDKNLIPLKYANDTYSKLGTDNIYTGTQNFNSNVVMGDDVSDTLTLNSTLVSNAVSITPTNLSKVQYLSSVSSNVQDQINAKTTLAQVLSDNSTFIGQKTFNGDLHFNNTLTFYNNLLANGKTISPATFGNLEFLSSVSSNVQDQINVKTTLAQVLSDNSTFIGQKTFNGDIHFNNTATFNNDVSARDLFLYSGASNRTIQWINSTNLNNVGLIEGDITGEYLKVKSKNDLQFVNQSDELIAKINKNSPTDNKDIVLLETLNRTIPKPSVFCIGKSAETGTVLNLDSGIVYINSASNRKIQTVAINISYLVHTSTANGLVSANDTAQIRLNATIGIMFNKQNTSSITIKTYTINGNTQMLASNMNSGNIGYSPISVGRIGERLTLQYNWKSNSWINHINTTWISAMFCSMEIQGSYTGGIPFVFPNENASSNSGTGDLYFSLT
jgi:hypothetical protein